MNPFRQVCFLGLLLPLLFSVGCRHKSSSSSKAEELPEEKVRHALALLGAEIEGLQPIKSCAGSCHWHDVNRDVVTNQWARKTLEMYKCFNENPMGDGQIGCFSPDGQPEPKLLGIYRAGAHTGMFQRMFTDAGRSVVEYRSFLHGVDGGAPAARMPPERQDGDEALTEEEFQIVLDVFTHPNGIEAMQKVFGDVVISNEQCETNITPELIEHVDVMRNEGWGARNFSNGIQMFGCSPPNSDYDPIVSPITDCFRPNWSDGDSDADNYNWNSPFQVDWARGWDKAKGVDGRYLKQSIRILSDFNGLTTTFWMRSSADGRFVGNGKEGGSVPVPGAPNASGFIIDLLDNFVIGVNAQYDPGFFPDNNGFTFISGDTMFCSQNLLLPPPSGERKSFIRLEAESQFCSNGQMSVYQHVGASLEGGDYTIVRGNHANDDGGDYLSSDPAASFREDSTVQVFKMCEMSQCSAEIKQKLEERPQSGPYGITKAHVINIPYEGDFGISPSGRLLTSRIAAEDGQTQIGYRIRAINDDLQSTRELGTVCVKGGKATVSFDESVLAVHHYTDESDWKEFNTVRSAENGEKPFEGPNDPEFRRYVRNTANIWLTNLRTGERFRITYMQPGQFALYPHFRSDGWLYFLVRDSNQRKDFVVATDAALRMRYDEQF
jgi:hypothetical protein